MPAISREHRDDGNIANLTRFQIYVKIHDAGTEASRSYQALRIRACPGILHMGEPGPFKVYK